jgi:hypothetical protein
MKDDFDLFDTFESMRRFLKDHRSHMEDEPILTEAALEANSRFIIPFATRKFRQRIFFPPSILTIFPPFVKPSSGFTSAQKRSLMFWTPSQNSNKPLQHPPVLSRALMRLPPVSNPHKIFRSTFESLQPILLSSTVKF